ncbi:redoxin domain-containing protein, partial [Streptomyces sp. SID7803]|nr:redoxin domain-containing protein [Streptomyces sp. SID7803]
SIGGLIAPALGAAAQAYGPQGVFTILCAIPVLALFLGLFLTEPEPSPRVADRPPLSRSMLYATRTAPPPSGRSTPKGTPMGSSPQIGSPVPDFTLPGGVLAGDSFERRDYALADARGRALVLAFYRVTTPPCAPSSCARTPRAWRPSRSWTRGVGGISPQDVDSHESFARSQGAAHAAAGGPGPGDGPG